MEEGYWERLAAEQPIYAWIHDSLRPYIQADYHRDMAALAEMQKAIHTVTYPGVKLDD